MTATSDSNTVRELSRVLGAQPTQDGAGVSLFRAIGQPALGELDPFLLLDELHSDRADDYIAGFPSHPHRGFETLSYMVSGEMRHLDSQGNRGVVGSGGVQWMRAGRGIVHSETPAQSDGLLWGYQLWVNLPAARKMDAPAWYDMPAAQIPVVDLANDGFMRVIAGRGIAELPGPVVRDDIDMVFLDIQLAPHSQLEQPVPCGHNAFVYMADGRATFGGDAEADGARVAARQVGLLGAGGRVRATTGDEPARFLLIAGRPIGEPIARYGPFVMNTQQEIARAIHDFQNGVLA